MTEIHYAYQQVEELRGESDILKLFVLVDGVQYDRAFDEPLKEIKVSGRFSVFLKIGLLLLLDHGYWT